MSFSISFISTNNGFILFFVFFYNLQVAFILFDSAIKAHFFFGIVNNLILNSTAKTCFYINIFHIRF